MPISRSPQLISSIIPRRTGEYKCSIRYLCVLKNASTYNYCYIGHKVKKISLTLQYRDDKNSRKLIIESYQTLLLLSIIDSQPLSILLCLPNCVYQAHHHTGYHAVYYTTSRKSDPAYHLLLLHTTY